jgi:hypothetical protein
MAKVDKRAAGHSTKHEIPVLISADTKMVDTTDYGHTMVKFLILCSIIWDMDIKAQFFVEIMVDYYGKHGQGTHCTKIGADNSAENTSNAPKFIFPNCLPKSESLVFR